jgi:hypothetical protein
MVNSMETAMYAQNMMYIYVTSMVSPVVIRCAARGSRESSRDMIRRRKYTAILMTIKTARAADREDEDGYMGHQRDKHWI